MAWLTVGNMEKKYKLNKSMAFTTRSKPFGEIKLRRKFSKTLNVYRNENATERSVSLAHLKILNVEDMGEITTKKSFI